MRQFVMAEGDNRQMDFLELVYLPTNNNNIVGNTL